MWASPSARCSCMPTFKNAGPTTIELSQSEQCLSNVEGLNDEQNVANS